MRKAILHHSAVSREKNNNQFDAIKRYHIGKGWGNIGYNFLIEPDGEIKKGRKIGTMGAHTIGHNEKIGICLTGNFDIENPTQKQLDSLKVLIKIYRIALVEPHRKYAKKSCPGKNITDKYIKSLTNTPMEYVIQDGEQYIRYVDPFKIALNIADEPQLKMFLKKGLRGTPTEVSDIKDYLVFPLVDKKEVKRIVKELRDKFGL